jgi:hypothetical protein
VINLAQCMHTSQAFACTKISPNHHSQQKATTHQIAALESPLYIRLECWRPLLRSYRRRCGLLLLRSCSHLHTSVCWRCTGAANLGSCLIECCHQGAAALRRFWLGHLWADAERPPATATWHM